MENCWKQGVSLNTLLFNIFINDHKIMHGIKRIKIGMWRLIPVVAYTASNAVCRWYNYCDKRSKVIAVGSLMVNVEKSKIIWASKENRLEEEVTIA